MTLEFSKIIIPAIAGLLAGFLGSLVAPWIHWGIEKKKHRRETQSALLSQARELLCNENLSNKEFRNTLIYSQVKPHLSSITVKAIEGEHSGEGVSQTEVINIVVGENRMSGVNPFRNQVLDELTLLEKKWKLI